MNKQPIVAIYKDGSHYRVEIDGKKIERLRSFEILVSNEPKVGFREWPFYRIEQYLPTEKIIQKIQDVKERTLKQPPEQSEETPESQGQTSS